MNSPLCWRMYRTKGVRGVPMRIIAVASGPDAEALILRCFKLSIWMLFEYRAVNSIFGKNTKSALMLGIWAVHGLTTDSAVIFQPATIIGAQSSDGSVRCNCCVWCRNALNSTSNLIITLTAPISPSVLSCGTRSFVDDAKIMTVLQR